MISALNFTNRGQSYIQMRTFNVTNILVCPIYLYGRKDREVAAVGKRQILAVAEVEAEAVAEVEVEALVLRTLLRSRGAHTTIKDFKASLHF